MTGIEAAREIAQLPVDDDDAELTAWPAAGDRLHHRLRPVRGRGLRAGRRRLRAQAGRARAPAGHGRAHQEAPGASAQRTGDAAATRAAMQQLLHKLAAQINPGAHAGDLKWIQATVGQSIQMIPVEDVLFFICDEKYTRVQTAHARGADPQADQGAGRRARPEQFWQIHRSTLVNTRLIAGVTPRLARPPARRGEGPPREARGEPQLRGAVQGDVDGARVRRALGAAARSALSFSRGSSTRCASSSFISAMKRLGSAGHHLAARFLRRSSSRPASRGRA